MTHYRLLCDGKVWRVQWKPSWWPLWWFWLGGIGECSALIIDDFKTEEEALDRIGHCNKMERELRRAFVVRRVVQ